MLGTVGYMAPEQATGAADVDARVDVFALGCVLFECLTGRPAFSGAHAVAVLAKVLCEPAPLVSAIRPELKAFDALVVRLLAKERDDRPSDSREVLNALDQLRSATQTTAPDALHQPLALTESERKIMSVIFAEPPHAATGTTLTPEQVRSQWSQLETVAARFGALLSTLAGGTLVFVLSSHGVATDQARQAAACALGVRALRPELRVVLATAWTDVVGPLPVGPIIDTAARLLRDQERAVHGADGVQVDAVTASLVGSFFEIRESGTDALLIGERSASQRGSRRSGTGDARNARSSGATGSKL